MSEDRRKRRTEIRHLQSESVWLQKALFALRKAESARDRLAEARGEEEVPYELPVGDESMPAEVIEDALEARAKELIETVRQMRRNLI